MKKLLLLTLFALAFLERIVFDLGPNIELVTAVMIVSAYYLGKRNALWLVLLIMIATDLIIGNTRIFLFTWSGFLIPILLIVPLLKRYANNKIAVGTALGLGANMFFYLWTNFGVWALDAWGMYTNDANGLITSYVNGLPFLKLQATGTLLFVPLLFVAIELSIFTYQKLSTTSRCIRT